MVKPHTHEYLPDFDQLRRWRSHPTFDVLWLLAQVRTVQHELCRRYDVVVV